MSANNTIYYTVYKTICLINKKEYIGVHATKDLNDSYLGSGTLLGRAIKKYGKHNFVREILFIFDNPQSMYLKEEELVTEEYVGREDTYNKTLGGRGGFSGKFNPMYGSKRFAEKNPFYKKHHTEECKRRMSESAKRRPARTKETLEKMSELNRGQNNPRYGVVLSDDLKQKISNAKTGKKCKRGICPYCKKDLAITIITRYHMEKCKEYVSL